MPKRSSKPKTTSSSPPLEEEQKVRTNQWLIVCYQPVSLFSLKRSDATSMAARSNLVPTPYCIKMTLLKTMLEEKGKFHINDFDQWIEKEFTWIRDLEIRVLPPEKLVVNRNGYKLRYTGDSSAYSRRFKELYDREITDDDPIPLQDGFVFREWVHLEGVLAICCGTPDRIDDLERLLVQINYFGKRGCFFQYLPEETCKVTEMPQRFQIQLEVGFTIQPWDDFGDQATFSRINPFSKEDARLGRDRVIKTGLLPLWLAETSAKYDFYRRLQQ